MAAAFQLWLASVVFLKSERLIWIGRRGWIRLLIGMVLSGVVGKLGLLVLGRISRCLVGMLREMDLVTQMHDATLEA